MTELEQLRAERDTLRTQLAATSGALERAREAWARLRPFCPEGSPSMPQWKHSEHFQAARAMDAALAEPTHDAVMVGLEQSARGEVTDLGDFTQCAEHEDNCHFLFMEKPGTCTCKAAPTSGPGEAVCGLCGQPARGYAFAGDVRLCHPDEGQDCYHLWTVYGQRPAPPPPKGEAPERCPFCDAGYGVPYCSCRRAPTAPGAAKPAEPEAGRRRVDQLAHVVMWWLHSMDEEALKSTEAALERINLTHSRYLDCYLRDGLLAAVGDQLRALTGEGTRDE